MKDGEREQPIENYGKKEQKEWLDNILPDPHPCTAGNKEEEHNKTLLLGSLNSFMWGALQQPTSCKRQAKTRADIR